MGVGRARTDGLKDQFAVVQLAHRQGRQGRGRATSGAPDLAWCLLAGQTGLEPVQAERRQHEQPRGERHQQPRHKPVVNTAQVSAGSQTGAQMPPVGCVAAASPQYGLNTPIGHRQPWSVP